MGQLTVQYFCMLGLNGLNVTEQFKWSSPWYTHFKGFANFAFIGQYKIWSDLFLLIMIADAIYNQLLEYLGINKVIVILAVHFSMLELKINTEYALKV